jgi:genome maintenance exonuclease 1
MFDYQPVKAKRLPRVEQDGKRYYDCEGLLLPSVTTITSIHNETSIAEWKERVGAEEATKIGARAGSRGTRIHNLCESYLKNDEVKPNMFDREIWNSIKPVLNNITTVYGLEVPLYSKYLRAAGTADCFAQYGNRLSVIDFKTSTKRKKMETIHHYFMQAAAYAVMWEELYAKPINQLVIIIAVDDDEPQVFQERRDTWIGGFLSLRREYEKRFGV